MLQHTQKKDNLHCRKAPLLVVHRQLGSTRDASLRLLHDNVELLPPFRIWTLFKRSLLAKGSKVQMASMTSHASGVRRTVQNIA